MFKIENFNIPSHKTGRYKAHLRKLRAIGLKTSCIKNAVEGAVKRLANNKNKSFVIYGEPQSGKTEMMIALTARLLDDKHRVIVHLLNDSVPLLEQNLDRFKRSGLAPSPKNFQELLDPTVDISRGEWVIFCKKNSNDLQKLIEKLKGEEEKIIIDDEADYATPNSKINLGKRTRINELIGDLLGDSGIYIGVTATPARLDLNNTFMTDSGQWVNFPPHEKYIGQDIFFPISEFIEDFTLNLLPGTGNDPQHAREAVFSFLVNVAYLNQNVNDDEENYSMLIHTSGKKIDHQVDKKMVEQVIVDITNQKDDKYESNIRSIWNIAEKRFSGKANDLVKYIIDNISRYSIIVMNSERDKNVHLSSASNPSALFTFVIGGNIVSRGVTFNNLLSMFFTRNVRTKLQQDTYIQRARMFGSRGDYLEFFELTIPEQLYLDWHKCFIFHKLALTAIKEGKDSPVWLADKRISAVAGSSIDRTTVSMNKGEMGFALFNYDNDRVEEIIDTEVSPFKKLDKLRDLIGEDSLPEFLIKYIKQFLPDSDESVALHEPLSIAGYQDAPGLDKKSIERARGFFGVSQMQKSKFPKAIHHLRVFYNDEDKARLIYKFDGSIQFIKNLSPSLQD